MLGKMETLAERDRKLEDLWEHLEDVSFEDNAAGDLVLAETWHHFEAGTTREDIWHWFDERHSKGVAYLLYGNSEDYVQKCKELYALKSLCFVCSNLSCAFLDGGKCKFPLVRGRTPFINDEDECFEMCLDGYS